MMLINDNKYVVIQNQLYRLSQPTLVILIKWKSIINNKLQYCH
jgi:hypothetical protein